MERLCFERRMEGERVGRREFTAGAAGVAAALAGCSRLRSAIDGSETSQVSLTIKTMPDDNDPYAIRIARHLEDHLQAVGVETEITPMAPDQLLRSLLIDHEFDLYVARHPGGHDPDFLRSVVHSRFGDDPGWQNPFGFAELDVDELVERQRDQHTGERRSTVMELQRTLARTQPFTVVAHPDSIHAVRTDRIPDWPGRGIQSPSDLLSLQPRADGSLERLRMAITDPLVTRNRNPLAVEFRDRDLVTGMLYEPLARTRPDRLEPRLATDWSWETDDDGLTATVDVREAVWHDGTPVTAEDVAFTYRFIADTSLGEGDVPVPAPRYRGRVSLVESAEAVDDLTVRLRMVGSPVVARRAFTVPILPIHEWESRATEAQIAGIDLFGGTTEALVWANPEPVGSGPLAFERAAEDEALVLSRFDDHWEGDEERQYPRYERLALRVVPSDDAGVELVAADEVDATGPLFASVAPRIARADEASLIAGGTSTFYHVGYNTRHEPLNNPRFRQAAGALLDRTRLITDAFGGYATPSVSPLISSWVPPELEWNGTDPVSPFPGRNGELDVEAARTLFEEAGYDYRDDGAMVS
jgi:peptide/nickel transport system substrate-binding protein